METPLDTVVYADEPTASVYWLENDSLVVSPLMADGTFSAASGSSPARVADDLTAHHKRIEAALHRADARPDLAEKADRDAVFYDGCADRSEAACMGHRELGGVKPPIVEARIARMTVRPGPNRAPALLAGSSQQLPASP